MFDIAVGLFICGKTRARDGPLVAAVGVLKANNLAGFLEDDEFLAGGRREIGVIVPGYFSRKIPQRGAAKGELDETAGPFLGRRGDNRLQSKEREAETSKHQNAKTDYFTILPQSLYLYILFTIDAQSPLRFAEK